VDSGSLVVEVEYEERYWYPDDGGQVWLAGYHAEALASDDAEPGRPLELRRDPGNPHDANAIAVHGRGGEQLGWVPRETAAELAPEVDAGRPWAAVVLREQRRSPRDPRHGLTMLLAAAPAIELRMTDREARH
jgi:hypothetical protein